LGLGLALISLPWAASFLGPATNALLTSPLRYFSLAKGERSLVVTSYLSFLTSIFSAGGFVLVSQKLTTTIIIIIIIIICHAVTVPHQILIHPILSLTGIPHNCVLDPRPELPGCALLCGNRTMSLQFVLTVITGAKRHPPAMAEAKQKRTAMLV